MSSLLKLDGRTTRGRQLKELNSCGKPMKQGILHSKKCCSKCNEAPAEDDIIECMCCNQLFHPPCLLKPVDENFLKLSTENPSVFWFCLGCLSSKSVPTGAHSDDVNTGNDSTETDAGFSDVILQSTLMNFKKEMLKLVSETMDEKLKKFTEVCQGGSKNKAPAGKKQLSELENISNSVLDENRENGSWAELCKKSVCDDIPSVSASKGVTENAEFTKERSEKQILLVEPIDMKSATSDECKKKSLQAIGKAIGDVNIEFCAVKKSGLVAVGFSDADSKKLAEKRLNENHELSTAFKTRLPQKLLPKVTVSGISEVLFESCNGDKDEMKRILKNDIISRNYVVKNILESNPDEEFEVVMLQKVMPSNYYVNYIAALKLSARLRKAIYDSGDKLYISLKRCLVKDRFHVLQCYHCQKPGHSANECPSESPTCGFCSKDHPSKECPHKKSDQNQCCTNCLNSNNADYVKVARTHNAGNRKCPILKSHIETIKRKTQDWHGKNPNL